MKSRKTVIFAVILLFLFIETISSFAKDKTAILIIAHGSHSTEWNTSVQSLEKIVSERLLSENFDCEVRIAFMEMAKPTIAEVVRELEASGVESIFALPLFTNASGHSMFDIPSILGLSFNKDTIQSLLDEGIEIVDTKIKIVLGPTLDYGDLIQVILLDRVRELSISPENEGIVLLTHGSSDFAPFWHKACKKAGAYICAKSGITKFDYAFIEVGQSFETEGLPCILGMAENCERVIVLGLYLSLAPGQIASRYLSQQKLNNDWFSRQNIYFSDKGLLPDDRLKDWIVERILEWIKANENMKEK